MPDESGIPPLEIGPDLGGDPIFGFFLDILSQLQDLLIGAINAVITVLNALSDLVNAIGTFLKKIWDKVLKPLLQKMEQLVERLHRIYNKIIRPILQQIQKQRLAIRRIYELYFRPVLDALQGLRAFLAITHLNNTAFGRALDQRLQRLEGKIAAPIVAALRTINDQARLLNVILAPDLLFQSVTHVRSAVKEMGHLADAFYNLSRVKTLPARDATLALIRPSPSAAENHQAFTELLHTGSGALAEDYTADKTAFRQALAGG